MSKNNLMELNKKNLVKWVDQALEQFTLVENGHFAIGPYDSFLVANDICT